VNDEPQRVMGSVDLFREDGSYLSLEQDWRRGLGWWLVEGHDRRHLSVGEAVRAAPAEVAHEVLFEAALLVPVLELSRGLWDAGGAEMHRAVEALRGEVTGALSAYSEDRRVVAPRIADRVPA
jgi:hypothetical protein